MTEPLPLGTERVLVLDLHPERVLDESAQLCEPRLGGLGPTLELFMPAPRRLQLAPGHTSRGAAPQLPVAAERVEYVELVGGSCEPPLLELPGHRDHALGRGRHVVARRRSAPRVRTSATVAEHTARQYEPFLVLRPELGQRLEPILLEQAVRQVELGLHVRLLPTRTDERRVTSRSEQQPDRLGEDRLARPGLARDRIQARRELELGVANQDQVLDAQTAQHAPDGTHRVGARLPAFSAWSRRRRSLCTC